MKPNPNSILPTKREVIECLRGEIAIKRLFSQLYETHVIRCLEVALLLVRSKFPRVRRGR